MSSPSVAPIQATEQSRPAKSEIDSESPGSLDQFISPETGPFRVQVERHDDHNLDIKSLLEFGAVGGVAELNISIFMPPSAHLSTIDKNRVMGDFYSRGRLFYSRGESLKSEDLKNTEQKMMTILESANAEISPGVVEELGSLVRVYGAVLGELVKAAGEKQKRFLMMSHSLISHVADLSRLMDELRREIDNTYRMPNHLRRRMDLPTQDKFPVLNVLETYIHHIYVDYLGALQEVLLNLRTSLPSEARFLNGWNILQTTLSECRSAEADRASQFLKFGDVLNDRQDQELAVLRYSHMKKFFQSTTFVDVARRESLKKMNEPIAAVGAALAAIAAGFVEHMGSHYKWGLESIAVLFLGAAIYTLKDRLKDIIRKVVLKKVTRYVADLENDLHSEGKKLGNVKEWFNTCSSSEVRERLRDLRRMACISEPEKHLHEDVLLYRKQIRFEAENSGRQGRFFQDLLRINVERYLKYFDDHEKSFRFLDASGNVSLVRSHRVYHFHLGVEMSLQTAGGPSLITKFFRIVMDKNGIDRVEPLV